MIKAWFLLSPLLWLAVGWGTIDVGAGLLFGLLSFIVAVSAYLLAHRYGSPAPGALAAGFGLVGPFIIAGLFPALGGGERTTTVTVTLPAQT